MLLRLSGLLKVHVLKERLRLKLKRKLKWRNLLQVLRKLTADFVTRSSRKVMARKQKKEERFLFTIKVRLLTVRCLTLLTTEKNLSNSLLAWATLLKDGTKVLHCFR